MTRRTFPWYALLLVSILPLAGCATETADEPDDADDGVVDEDHDHDAHEHDEEPADPVALDLVDAPGAHTTASRYVLMFTIEAPAGTTSDHVGAHWGPARAAEPSVAAYPSACDHHEAGAGDTVTVGCDLLAGIHYMRGHLRITDADGAQMDYWTEEWRIEVAEAVQAPEFSVLVQGLPNSVTVGEPFNYTLVVTGDGNATSDHIGGHFGNVSTTEPSTDVYDVSCIHVEGGLPGTFTVSCTAPEPGTFYLRGHARIQDTSGDPINFWGEELSFEAS